MADWTYWHGLRDGREPALLRRKVGGETERWNPATKAWVPVPGDGLVHAISSGDLGYNSLTEAEAIRRTQ